MSYKAYFIKSGQKVVAPAVFNNTFDEVQRLGNITADEGIEIIHTPQGVHLTNRGLTQVISAKVGPDGITARDGTTLGTGMVYRMLTDGQTMKWDTGLVRVLNHTTCGFVADDEILLYLSQEQHWVMPIPCEGEGGAGGGTGRCDCPEDSYDVTVDCGLCGDLYDTTNVMPKFFRMHVTLAIDNPYDAYTSEECINLDECKFILENEVDGYDNPTCIWSGVGTCCFSAELDVSDDPVVITIFFPNTTDIAARLFLSATEFKCCDTENPMTGWAQEDDGIYGDDKCVVEVSLIAHECTCCPDRTCPPDDKPLCTGTTCCVGPCNISITVDDLFTPTPIPCTQFEDPCYTIDGDPCPFPVGDPGRLSCFSSVPSPEESCGGMNGVHDVHWVSNCTWIFFGTPAGGGNTEVTGVLTLSGLDWNYTIYGSDGQVAVFEISDWECGDFPIILAFNDGASTCNATSPAPTATIISF